MINTKFDANPWLIREEISLSYELHKRGRPRSMGWRGWAWVAALAITAIAQTLHADDWEHVNPHEITMADKQTREIPGGGWQCDKCGWRWSNGSKCAHCGAPR